MLRMYLPPPEDDLPGLATDEHEEESDDGELTTNYETACPEDDELGAGGLRARPAWKKAQSKYCSGRK